MVYGNQGNVDRETARLLSLTISELILEYEKLKSSIEKNREDIRNCHSDMCYWSYIADSEEFVAVKKYIESILINYLLDSDCGAIKNMSSAVANKDKLNLEISDSIKNISFYKPSGYKKMLELINCFSEILNQKEE